MKKHIITKQQISIVYKNPLAASHGNGEAKTLTMYGWPGLSSQQYEVISHGESLYLGYNLDEAIEVYNNA